MADKNQVILIGRISTELKPIDTKNESSMVSFNLITNEYQGKEKPELVVSHSIVAYRHDADYLLEYASVGDKLFLDGRLRYHTKGEGDDVSYYTNVEVTGTLDLTRKNSEKKKSDKEKK